MPSCPHCGKETPTGAIFCPNCGTSLSQGVSGPTVVGMDPVTKPIVDVQRSDGLGNLRNAFLLYLIGSLLSLVPSIGVIGGIIVFVGLIYLILGWRTLGRSSLVSASSYKSTGSWFLYSILAVIIIVVVGATALVIGLIGSILASQTFGSPSNISAFYQSRQFNLLIAGFIILVAVAEVPIILSWNKMRSSMGLLGAELSQPGLARSGLLFFVSALLGLASLLIIAAALLNGLNSNSGTALNYFSLLGSPLVELEAVIGGLLNAAAAFLGYGGVSRALSTTSM